MTHPPTTKPGGRTTARVLLILALIGALTMLARWRLLDVPLERDEGGFAVMGRLILDGVPPYAGAFDYKPPGLYLAYALFMFLFGGTAAGIHAGLLLTSLGTMFLSFGLARRWSDETGGLLAALLSQAFLASSSLLGFAAHATHFVVFWALAAILLVERGLASRRPWMLIAAGAAYGLATLMKQPGAVFFLAGLARPFFGSASPAPPRRPVAAAGLLAAGFVLPLAAVAVWLASARALDDFFYWNFTYPALVSAGSGTGGLVPRLARNALQAAGPFLPAWIAGAAGFAWLMTPSSRFRVRGPLALFVAASAASVAVGYETRSHYFVLLVPALAAAAGIAAATIAWRFGPTRAPMLRGAIVLAPVLLGAAGVASQWGYFTATPAAVISRSIYNPNQFADAEPVAAWIREHTSDTDRVAVLGSEPEILFLSGRRSASRYLFTNFFNERHGMKERMEREMIAEIEAAAPAVVVMVNQPFSWGAMPSGDWPILRWARGYLGEHYRLAGTVTPVSPTASRILWEEEARREPDALAAPLIIFLRNPGPATPPPPP